MDNAANEAVIDVYLIHFISPVENTSSLEIRNLNKLIEIYKLLLFRELIYY